MLLDEAHDEEATQHGKDIPVAISVGASAPNAGGYDAEDQGEAEAQWDMWHKGSRFVDDVSGRTLKPKMVHEARMDEVRGINRHKVWDKVVPNVMICLLLLLLLRPRNNLFLLPHLRRVSGGQSKS